LEKVIKNGTIVTATDVFQADIRVKGERIVEIAEEILPSAGAEVIDASGQYVMPGGIDVHTHLAWPFQSTGTADDFESGSKAAAVGGITSIINFTNPGKNQTLIENLHEWKGKAKISAIDYGFHSIINEYSDEMLEELPVLANEEGVTSIKLFMAYKGELMVNDLEMYKIMKKAGELGIVTNVHAENGDIIDDMVAEAIAKGNTDPIYHAYTRPAELEAEATARALSIAEVANAPVYIVHVSCKEALEKVEMAKKRGVTAFAETCPQYLVLDESYLALPDFEGGKYVCSPPLRDKSNQEVLWSGLASGSLSTLGSDHCPFRFEGQKTMGRNNFSKIPNGVPGIEDLYSIAFHYGVQEGRISLQKFVDITSTAPAKLFGLYPNKGSIAVGFDADLVLVDPNRTRTISAETQYQNLDYNAYEGREIQGVITHVLSRGDVIAKEGKFTGQLGRGKYQFRRGFNSSLIGGTADARSKQKSNV
jgi:dihydropyrimidinase